MPTKRTPERLRVLTLIDAVQAAGGAERLAVQLTRGLDPNRFEPALCVSRWPETTRPEPSMALADDLERNGVELLKLDRHATLDLWSWRPLIAALRQGRFHILHAHMFGSNVWATVFGRSLGVPVVIAHEHTWSFEGDRLRRVIDRELVGRFADACIAVSSEDRRRMIEVEGIRPERILLLPNGIPAHQGVDGTAAHKRLRIDPRAPVVGAVSVLRPQKAIEVLVRAAALLVPVFPDLKVLVVGDGEESGRIAALAEEFGLRETVELLGLRTDVPDLLATFNVAVNCSDFEGSPLAVMEYMEAGRPIVATRVGGVPDLIEDERHGLLVQPRDPHALAAAIARMLRNPEEAAAMGRRARERRRSEFTLELMVRRLESIYEELYAAKLRSGRSGRLPLTSALAAQPTLPGGRSRFSPPEQLVQR